MATVVKTQAVKVHLTTAQRREAHLSRLVATSRKHIDELLEVRAQQDKDLAIVRSYAVDLEAKFEETSIRARAYQDHLRRLHAAVTRYIEALTGGDEGLAGAALFWLGAQHSESNPHSLAGFMAARDKTAGVAPKEEY